MLDRAESDILIALQHKQEASKERDELQSALQELSERVERVEEMLDFLKS
jgi:hypothetical protein